MDKSNSFYRWKTMIFLVVVLFFSSPLFAGGKDMSHLINCDIQHGTCRQALAGGYVILNILPRPVKAMADLTFEVRFEGIQPEAKTIIDLSMPGMKMGKNRVSLKPKGDQTLSGKGIIVRCPSGRTVWQASVIVPNLGKADFIFDVIY